MLSFINIRKEVVKMANFSPHYNLELPISPEHYNIGVLNKNNLVIDSELYKLNLKNKRQDEIFATIESLNQEVTRAITKENKIIEIINAAIGELKESDKIMQEDYSQKIEELLFLFLQSKTELFKIVDSLPTSDISPQKIYLLPHIDSSENNRYKEYIYVNGEYVDGQYVNGQWESIGLINLDNKYETENIIFPEIFPET